MRIEDYVEEHQDSIDESPTGNGEETEQESIEFWEMMHGEAKDAFDRGIESIRRTEKTSLEFMKFDLLLGSIFAALLQFDGNPLATPEYLPFLIVPYVLLLFSMLAFLSVFTKLSGHTLAPNAKHLKHTIEDGHSQKRYLRIMSTIYFEWSDDNIDRRNSTTRNLGFGLGLMIASLGMYFITFLFALS